MLPHALEDSSDDDEYQSFEDGPDGIVDIARRRSADGGVHGAEDHAKGCQAKNGGTSADERFAPTITTQSDSSRRPVDGERSIPLEIPDSTTELDARVGLLLPPEILNAQSSTGWVSNLTGLDRPNTEGLSRREKKALRKRSIQAKKRRWDRFRKGDPKSVHSTMRKSKPEAPPHFPRFQESQRHIPWVKVSGREAILTQRKREIPGQRRARPGAPYGPRRSI